MRDYLRRTCDSIWVIGCSPEGHQPEVNTRIFQAVQQPVCIVLASRSAKHSGDAPARVRFCSLPLGSRTDKFAALGQLALDSEAWVDCPSEWRAPFLPASKGPWATYVALEEFFIYSGSGVMPGRTWIIAPDPQSLLQRWQALIHAALGEKETLFHPHLVKGKPGDKHANRVTLNALHGFAQSKKSVAAEQGPCTPPIRYGFRSFDRQWIIPDNRLINRPNPELWAARSDRQIYLTAFTEESPTNGPALTFTALIPDLHHYKGSFGGRVYPLWSDENATVPNIRSKLISFLSQQYGVSVGPQELLAYIAAVASHPAFTARFQHDLSTPGLRIPLTEDGETFAEAVALGRTVIWLHTFGERMADPKNGRPAQPPRLPPARRPRVPAGGTIPEEPAGMPDTLEYDAPKKRLMVGAGYVENVEPAVWNYEVSGKQVLLQWFSYRKANRDRPIMGDRRPPSPLGNIQPDYWLAEYTSDLIDVLNVLGWLVDLEPLQAALLDKICSGLIIAVQVLKDAGVLDLPPKPTNKPKRPKTAGLFDAVAE
jgi:hypothetical protein